MNKNFLTISIEIFQRIVSNQQVDHIKSFIVILFAVYIWLFTKQKYQLDYSLPISENDGCIN